MEFKLKAVFDASPKEVYSTWLSSAGHSNMTGGKAEASGNVGDKFSAWDGYIEGQNLELQPYEKIVQSWRTSEFNEAEEDSKIEILLKDIDGKTEVTLIHTDLPETGEHYKKGWEDHYFKPMKKFFD